MMMSPGKQRPLQKKKMEGKNIGSVFEMKEARSIRQEINMSPFPHC